MKKHPKTGFIAPAPGLAPISRMNKRIRFSIEIAMKKFHDNDVSTPVPIAQNPVLHFKTPGANFL
jgi:hypothetical protein